MAAGGRYVIRVRCVFIKSGFCMIVQKGLHTHLHVNKEVAGSLRNMSICSSNGRSMNDVRG